MWRRPLLEVRNGRGLNVLPALSGLWLEVSVTDKAGKESDSARIKCVGPPAQVALPKRGDTYTVLMGWADEGLVEQGRYTFQKATLSGDPEQGETMDLVFRSADFVDKLKASGRKHYDATTYGDLVKTLAGEAGLGSQVDPELAKIKLGYRLRWDQSLIDFATEVSEEVGATVKPAGGKLVAMKRGGGKNGAGTAFAPILIRRRRGFGYEIEVEPRPEVGSVAAAWYDEKTGKRTLTKVSAQRQGPIRILPHPYRSEADAKAAAEAEVYASDNRSGSGYFESPGLPHARAEAPVTSSGYGPLIDGQWKAESVDKTVRADGGFLTTVHVTAGDDKKGEKGK
ncbi:phage late control D family protein [Methylobacterium aquaticum]|uniref:phage late control D family protein n=1 Tax=Methylobacterium aquaticum TaxID=270351 RepID=UPI003D1842B7